MHAINHIGPTYMYQDNRYVSGPQGYIRGCIYVPITQIWTSNAGLDQS